ncbi:MAG: hypothetical protein F6K48_33500, partial [Okeania sp. SIO3H1]|nr:hypothetical protein [Okeania sp. SIO3H1]
MSNTNQAVAILNHPDMVLYNVRLNTYTLEEGRQKAEGAGGRMEERVKS